MTARTSAAANQQPQAETESRGEQTNLSFRYGTIGIQAVAAAARYSGERNDPGYAAAPRIDLRFVESAG